MHSVEGEGCTAWAACPSRVWTTGLALCSLPSRGKERMRVGAFPSRTSQESGLCNGNASLLTTDRTHPHVQAGSSKELQASELPNGSAVHIFR